MSIFDFLRGEFIDVIHWTDDTRDTIVWRFEREGHAIKYGAKLTVREGQAAVFVHEGQLADTFGPGLYMLETNNLPVLTTLQHWDHGFQSPVQVRDLLRQHPPLHRPEVGDAEPDHLPRPGVRHGAAARLRHLHHAGGRPGEVPGRDRRHRRRVHHRGDRVPDPQHHRHPLQPDHRHLAASRCSTWPATPSSSPRSCTSGSRRWSPSTASSCRPSIIENVSLPAEVEAALDKRTATGGRRRPLALHRVQRRRGDDHGRPPTPAAAAAWPPASAWAWAWRWPSAWRAAAPGARRPSRRRPRRRRRRRAEALARRRRTARRPGPTAATSSGAMVADGHVTGDSWLWTPGGPDWQRGRDVTELADLFSAPPPPPPPA